MDIITGKILKLNNWPDGKIIGIAKTISAQPVSYTHLTLPTSDLV